MRCCEENRVYYAFGLARNDGLRKIIEPQMAAAARQHDQTGKPARALYEDLYCERGEMENRIKEQLTLFAGRASSATPRANQ